MAFDLDEAKNLLEENGFNLWGVTTGSTQNNDWEMIGKDSKKLQELINKLEIVQKEEQEKKNEHKEQDKEKDVSKVDENLEDNDENEDDKEEKNSKIKDISSIFKRE